MKVGRHEPAAVRDVVGGVGMPLAVAFRDHLVGVQAEERERLLETLAPAPVMGDASEGASRD